LKQNIQKSILLPFIIFTVILTGLLVTWSGFFIKTFLYHNEVTSLYSQLTNFKTASEQLLASNTLINQLAKNSKDIKYIIESYDNNYPEQSLYNLYKKRESPFQINAKDKHAIVKHNDDNIYLLQTIIKKNKESLISINLSRFVSNFKTDSSAIGILILDDNLNVKEHLFNDSLTFQQLTTIERNYNDFMDHTFPLQSSQHDLDSIFMRSSENPAIIYVATKTKSVIFSVIVQITIGIILVILLSTSWVFIMDLLIIKKMTTSIDILRSVSKKVAKGDFTEKVYIQSSDEIGELSIAFNQMITQLKESTDTIIKQKEQADAIIKCIPDGIIVTDFKNNLILANKKAEDIFEFKTQDNYSKNISQFIHHSSLQEHSSHLKKVETYASEISYTKESSEFILLMNSTVVHNRKNKPIGIIYLIRDITYEKEIEQLREGFLRTVSHELRTPLTSVIGFIELVTHSGKGQFSDEQESWLNTSLNEARTLKELINDLLELSQIQAKKTNLQPTSVNVFSFIDTITTSLSPLTKGKDLKLLNDVSDKDLMITVDKAKLRRIMVNLISNGIKFTKEGYVKISCIEKDDFVEFCIADTGIGLKENQQDVIFEKFRQVDYSSTREFEGIGLGLSIVKELVQLHEGDVRVESYFGQGSSFYFTIKKKRNLTATMVT
tara:strand:+ start:20737 stop:22731 length:1995 start_codon:yes stop_codon:yes gene_type:complete